MFGYVKAHKPEMKIKDYEAYRGVYCSLCRTLGKRYGLFARLTLSYDFTFLAVMTMALSDAIPDFEQKRCPFNPAKKCSFCKNAGSALDYTADVAMLMVYYKILDNIADGSLFKKILMLLIKPLFYRYYKKARKYEPEIDKLIRLMMERQTEIEKIGRSDIDEAADPTATAMGEILSRCPTAQTNARVLKRMGYLLGRWVYITDALDDMEKDKKTESYNPINLSGKSREDIIQTLNLTVNELVNAYELLEIKHFRAVTENIIYEGLYHSAQSAGGKK